MDRINTENGHTLAAEGYDGKASITVQVTRPEVEYFVPIDPMDELGCDSCQ